MDKIRKLDNCGTIISTVLITNYGFTEKMKGGDKQKMNGEVYALSCFLALIKST